MTPSRSLPPLLVLTDRRLTGGRPLVDVVRAAVAGGAEAVVLREKDLPAEQRAELAAELRTFVPILLVAIGASVPGIGSGGRAVAVAVAPSIGGTSGPRPGSGATSIAGNAASGGLEVTADGRVGATAANRASGRSATVPSDLGPAGGRIADGVHLSALATVPAPRPPMVGRSCHSAADLAAAAWEGCDYATISPIFLTASKPGYGPALGVDALRDPPLPVYALGGIGPAQVQACRDAGATGVAVMGHVMRADDPAVAVKELLP
jgi:thiamine-phosphate pyrophosphorylase